MDNEKKSRFGRIKLRTFVLVILAVYAAITFVDQSAKLAELRSQRDALQDELTSLQEEALELEGNLGNLDSMDYVEQVAREELNMVKDGEQAFANAGDR